MNALITLNSVYDLMGVVVMALATLTLADRGHPKRYTSALFWFLFGATFLFGDLAVELLGKSAAYRLVGVVVIVIALLAGTGQLAMGSHRSSSDAERQASATRLGNRIFIPAVLIPVVTVLGTLLLKDVAVGHTLLLDPKHLTLASLAVACVVALLAGWRLSGGSPLQAVQESRRLVDAIGWAAILPLMLAMLGGVFVAAQTGHSIQAVASLFIAPDNRFLLVVVYCVGMALFTMIMGNAFAAFPVMTAGIALPLVIGRFGGDPAVVCAIGMLSGFCGTLLTPLAANFNLVPAALLQLKDRYAVIRAQAPTAVLMLIVNVILMNALAFHARP